MTTIKQRRLAHAWLLKGGYGIGKATLAFRWARFVLTYPPNRSDLVAEDLWIEPSHPVFQRVASGGHADLRTIEASDNSNREIPIEEVRRLQHFLQHTPAENGWRVVIIDGAEQLSHQAQQALLKVLEEPPPSVLFLLVSNSSGGLLSTLVSRCFSLSLLGLSCGQVSDLIERYGWEERAEQRTLVAQLAEGSIGRAQDMIQAGGVELYYQMAGLLKTLPQLPWSQVHLFAEQGKGCYDRYKVICWLLLGWLARLIKMSITALPVNEQLSDEVSLAQQLGAQNVPWLRLWESLTELFEQAEQAALDRKQVLLSVFARIEQTARQNTARIN